MTKIKSHLNCKYFSYNKCSHINDEIMKLATQDIPEFNGVLIYMKFPPGDEVDKICSGCDTFTLGK